MSVKTPLVSIGFDKNAEFDFGISGTVCDLNVEHMNELRAMIVCAIRHDGRHVSARNGAKKSRSQPGRKP